MYIFCLGESVYSPVFVVATGQHYLWAKPFAVWLTQNQWQYFIIVLQNTACDRHVLILCRITSVPLQHPYDGNSDAKINLMQINRSDHHQQKLFIFVEYVYGFSHVFNLLCMTKTHQRTSPCSSFIQHLWMNITPNRKIPLWCYPVYLSIFLWCYPIYLENTACLGIR